MYTYTQRHYTYICTTTHIFTHVHLHSYIHIHTQEKIKSASPPVLHILNASQYFNVIYKGNFFLHTINKNIFRFFIITIEMKFPFLRGILLK